MRRNMITELPDQANDVGCLRQRASPVGLPG